MNTVPGESDLGNSSVEAPFFSGDSRVMSNSQLKLIPTPCCPHENLKKDYSPLLTQSKYGVRRSQFMDTQNLCRTYQTTHKDQVKVL